MRRRSPLKFAEKDAFVEDWAAVPNKRAPGRSRQQLRRRWVIGILLAGLSPVAVGGCLVATGASGTAGEALDAALQAEAAVASIEVPAASHVASARVARWAEESGIGPVTVAPASWSRVDHWACGEPDGFDEPAVDDGLPADGETEAVCESHAFRVVPATGDGSWELEATVLVNVHSGAASGVYVEFSQPPATQSLLDMDPPEEVPQRLEELLETWARAWVANDTAELADLANDVTGELALPPSGAPEGWVLDEQEGVRLLQKAGTGNPFSVLVEFRVTPPAKRGGSTHADGYEALLSGLASAETGDYGTLLSGLDEYAEASLSVPVTAEVSVLVEGSLARIVGWGPVGSPSGSIGAE